ncbi:hypothetical protein BDV93DRAFT_567009 [Ceratobasidium sp. AG-I]|nr:hypothetical protein BDV93DRAFT_567009 [Ceratobasidium sp. AG-I]
MEHEVLDLHRAQAALKKKRNVYTSPIHLLSSELLGYIFTIVAESTSPAQSIGVDKPSYDKRKLAQVCSYWRRVALEVCPTWPHVSLNFHASEGELAEAVIELGCTRKKWRSAGVYRHPGIDDASYIQTTLATIASYVRQLSSLDLAADSMDQLRPFLDLWLKKGTPGSLTELALSLSRPSLGVSGPSDRLNQFLRHIEVLELRSVGLEWSHITLEQLTDLTLESLPPFCCPSSAQLASILASCPHLQRLCLKRITVPAPLNSIVPKPVMLKRLKRLSLEELDFQKALSTISQGHSELDIHLWGTISGTETLEVLRSFASRANIRKVTLTLSETRADSALAHLLHFTINSFPDVKRLTLSGMNIRDSELVFLTNHFLAQEDDLESSTSVDTPGLLSYFDLLRLRNCTIYAAPATFHKAVLVLPLRKLQLVECNHCLSAQAKTDEATGVVKPIHTKSKFGTLLRECMPGRVFLPNPS